MDLFKMQIKLNKLEIVIYKHTTDTPDVYDYEFCSIQNCKYFSPRLLAKLIIATTEMLQYIPAIMHLKSEEWYLLHIMQNDCDMFDIIQIENVSKNSDEMYRLH